MTFRDLHGFYFENWHGSVHPIIIQMGQSVLRDYISAVASLPFEKRPFGWSQFMDAEVQKNYTLEPNQLRFVMNDGNVRDTFMAEPAS